MMMRVSLSRRLLAGKNYEGLELEFYYDFMVESNDVYYWVSVACPQVLDIRLELGLSREPSIPLHITIGNLKG